MSQTAFEDKVHLIFVGLCYSKMFLEVFKLQHVGTNFRFYSGVKEKQKIFLEVAS